MSDAAGVICLEVTATALADVRLVVPVRHGDERGWFSESWRRDALAAAGIEVEFVQDNDVFTARAGTVRGLHWQSGAAAQAKLVRVVRGAVFDVSVDVRPGSPTFGRHVAVELSAANGRQVFVPAGHAHGYCTLTPDTLVQYRVSSHYAPDAERGVRWSDPALGIDWPVASDEAIVNDRDRVWPLLADVAG